MSRPIKHQELVLAYIYIFCSCKCDYRIPLSYDDWGFLWNASHPVHHFEDIIMSDVPSDLCQEWDMIECEELCREESDLFHFTYSYSDPHPRVTTILNNYLEPIVYFEFDEQ